MGFVAILLILAKNLKYCVNIFVEIFQSDLNHSVSVFSVDHSGYEEGILLSTLFDEFSLSRKSFEV